MVFIEWCIGWIIGALIGSGIIALIEGEANDYIIIYYYVVHQSTYSIADIIVSY